METKCITLPQEKTVVLEKPKTKRIITETERWAFTPEELKPESQYNHVKPLFGSQHYPPGTQKNYNSFSSTDLMMEKGKELEFSRRAGGGKGEPGVPPIGSIKGDLSKNQQFILQQIKNKISGYKSQDNEKKKYDSEKFVTEMSVLTLFESSKLLCYYCQDPTLVLYEFVRDPKQWSLERLDNSKGHNTDNVVLACLKCNLKRRCIHSDRYLKTKQMTNVMKLS